MAITLNAHFEFTAARRLSAARAAYEDFMTATITRKTSEPRPPNYVRDFDALRKTLAREKRRHDHWKEVLRVERAI